MRVSVTVTRSCTQYRHSAPAAAAIVARQAGRPALLAHVGGQPVDYEYVTTAGITHRLRVRSLLSGG